MIEKIKLFFSYIVAVLELKAMTKAINEAETVEEFDKKILEIGGFSE